MLLQYPQLTTQVSTTFAACSCCWEVSQTHSQKGSAYFFFNATATTEIYTLSDTLSLHDALPILFGRAGSPLHVDFHKIVLTRFCENRRRSEEHTSELQSPINISYAVFCLKKKRHGNRRVRMPRRVLCHKTRSSPSRA